MQAKKSLTETLSPVGLAELGRTTGVVFRPVWNVEKNYLCGYIVRLVQKADADAQGSALQDIGLLLRASEALGELHARGGKSVVIVPAGFETLNLYPYRGHYLSLLRRIPEEVRCFIVLQLANIPPHAPKTRLQAIQRDVSDLCRAVVFTTDLRGVHLDCVSRSNVHACAVLLGTSQTQEDDFIGVIRRFADETGGINCAAMADDVSTSAELCAAVSSGFRYIAGKAVLADQQELGISRRDFSLSSAFGID